MADRTEDVTTRRRLCLGGLAAVVASTLPRAATAQSAARVPRVGMLWQTSPAPPTPPNMTALLQSLHELGWSDGKTIVVEARYGENQADRLAELAADLVQRPVAVITTFGDLSTRAAQRATQSIPIVAVVGFPVESGFVKSLARPGGNITGVAVLADELVVKRLEALKELMPGLSRVAVAWDPMTHEQQTKAAETAARTLGLRMHLVRAQAPAEIPSAFEAAARAGSQALLLLTSPMFLANRAAFIDLAAKHRLPTMYYNAAWVDAGGLIAYGPPVEEQWRIAAGLIDRILKGARPAELPVQQPTRLELTVNLKSARAQDVTIPPALLLRAHRIIE